MAATTSSIVENRLDQETSSIYKHTAKRHDLNIRKERITFSEFLADKMLVIFAIKEGLPYSFFKVVQDYVPFTENDWAALLDISTKSLQRYKQDARQFRSMQSEKIMEISEVTNVGLQVFGGIDKFKLWLNSPSFALGKMKPIELLKDSYGKELVLAELIRINHGILS